MLRKVERPTRLIQPTQKAALLIFAFDKSMNRDIVLFHLREAAEQLNQTIQSLASSGDYGAGEFQVEMGVSWGRP